MNKVFLIGRTCRDTETKQVKDTTVSKITLAVDRKFKEKEADFISCVAFGKTADFIEKYITKGTKIAIEGRWQTGVYENKEGQKVYTNDCIIDSVEFAESKKQDAPVTKDDTSSFMDVPDIDGEIPFQSSLPV